MLRALLCGGVAATLLAVCGCRDRDEQAIYAAVQAGHLARLERNSAAGRVLFIGQSTFAGMDLSRITPEGLNLSIGGELTSQMLQRVARYRAPDTARAVVVNTGMNDVVRGCALPADDDIQRVVRIGAGRVPLFVLGLQSVSNDRAGVLCGGGVAELISRTNDLLRARCSAAPRCTFIESPIHPTTATGSPSLHEPDGIHLSGAGYAALVAVLTDAIGKGGPRP